MSISENQKEESYEVSEKELDLVHIMRIGALVEDVEGSLRS